MPARDATCRCSAYPFPHRPLSGKCSHSSIIEAVWEHYSHGCSGCPHYQYYPARRDEEGGAECAALELNLKFESCEQHLKVVSE